jgi:hypothetical protein
MKAQEKKARRHPPCWCRAALVAAVWPRPEFYDYSRKLHCEYLRRLRDKGVREANIYARREAWVAGWRVFRAVTFFRTAE